MDTNAVFRPREDDLRHVIGFACHIFTVIGLDQGVQL
jgi:hypothetical protein